MQLYLSRAFSFPHNLSIWVFYKEAAEAISSIASSTT